MANDAGEAGKLNIAPRNSSLRNKKFLPIKCDFDFNAWHEIPLPLGLIAAITLFLFHSPSLRAQSPLAYKWREVEPPVPSPIARTNVQLPLPTPTPTVSPAPVDLRPSATFTFADGAQVKTESTTGRFRLLGLHLNEAVGIALESPAVLISNSVSAQSLDGGTISSFSMNPGGSGALASIRFQAGARPGLYRVFVPGLGAHALLQFWVIDPNNPKATPPVLNPRH